ncbi:MAG: hypothetical protein OXP69_06000, partial [Spirochaetaceae bacterium]|nr:hypothetical protein [Spirochaetaceae bacterium]
DMGKITLMGMESTWDADANTPVHSSVRVNLMARDTKGLETKAAVMVNVDAAPSLTALGQRIMGATFDIDGSRVISITNGTAFFDDDNADGGTAPDVAVTGAPENTNIARLNPTDLGTGVVVEGVTAGHSTTIKLEATETEGMGQTAEIEFTVNVTKVNAPTTG